MEPTQQLPKKKKKAAPYISKAKKPQVKVQPEDYRKRQSRNEDGEMPVRVNGETYKRENPYGANKWIPDPRREIMWEKYMKSWMKGAPNAKQAALDAGYSETTSNQVTNITWFKDRVDALQRKDFLSKAERNLGKFLDLDYDKLDEITGEVIGIDIDKAKLVADMTKLVTTTLGKDVGYSTKSLIDTKMQGEIHIKAVNYADTAIEAPQMVEAIASEVHEEL